MKPTRRASKVRRPTRSALAAAKAHAAEITAAKQAERELAAAIHPLTRPVAPIVPAREPKPQGGTRNRDLTDEDFARLERKWAAAKRRAEAEVEREALLERWSHKNEGTPETHERISAIPERRRQWPLDRMHAAGKISDGEHLAACEIADVIEMIERQVGVRCASLEARVDYSGSARDQLLESIGRIRLEVAYRMWRRTLPKPPRLILDMITSTQSYVGIARAYRTPWRRARTMLISALRRWEEIREVVWHDVQRGHVEWIYERLGEGQLMAPRPRPEAQTEEESE